jgi:hypothetical protein
VQLLMRGWQSSPLCNLLVLSPIPQLQLGALIYGFSASSSLK